VDPEKMHQAYRAFRAARGARKVIRGYKKTKGMLDAQRRQNDVLMDAENLARRIQDDKVRSEDVKKGARAIVNVAPDVFRAVAKYIAKRNAEKAAEKIDEEA
jgi:hypothetical protein